MSELVRESAMTRGVREIAWTALWDPERAGQGIELVRFEPAGRARSHAIVFDESGEPYRFSWSIEWAGDWTVRRARIRVDRNGRRRTLSLRTDGAGRWTRAGQGHVPALDGCIDIDIWPTPFTNTFPIRRLADRLETRTEIDVAWVRAPELAFQVARQAYTRLPDGRFRFESVGDAFTADLPVDPDGVVLDYPGLFRRVK